MNEEQKCTWVEDIPIFIDYHKNEWGRPVHDDIKSFEMLTLEGAQAGLSWLTILKKRENYREVFDGFDYQKVALYDEEKIAKLLENKGIVRNRLKVHSTVNNAKVFIAVIEKYGSFDHFIWSYVDHKPVVNHFEKMEDVPASTPLSDKISKDMKKMGFKFVGSTIIYAFMQATGMVNDHIIGCPVRQEILDSQNI